MINDENKLDEEEGDREQSFCLHVIYLRTCVAQNTIALQRLSSSP
jgi:hypothetical protein